MDAVTCPTCGRPLDTHDRHVRFGLPDPVLDLPDRESSAGVWMSHDTAQESVMMQVPNLGAFVRALLPVRLSGGHTVTYGVWVSIHPQDLAHAFEVWWAPEYAELRLRGALANTISPWGLLYAPVETEVRDPDQSPYCSMSPDETLDRVLHGEWDHDQVLSAIGKN